MIYVDKKKIFPLLNVDNLTATMESNERYEFEEQAICTECDRCFYHASLGYSGCFESIQKLEFALLCDECVDALNGLLEVCGDACDEFYAFVCPRMVE